MLLEPFPRIEKYSIQNSTLEDITDGAVVVGCQELLNVLFGDTPLPANPVAGHMARLDPTTDRAFIYTERFGHVFDAEERLRAVRTLHCLPPFK